MSSPGGTLGKYALLAKLATGGMGEIFLARLQGEGGFEKLVVVKRLLPELVADPQFVAMFLNEARIAAKLSHGNICDVYELGQEDGQYYIAMQYLQGVPFSRVAQEETSADSTAHLRLLSGLVQQACEGLHHAHELEDIDGNPLGLVHRDVSPSNLFVTADGILKVLDFGIAKAQGTPSQTSKGSIRGKVPYMSPEQIRGEPLDRRSDIYSLGVVLYEALTRRRLFRRESPFLVAKAILEETPPPANQVVPAVPAALSAVVRRAMSRDRRQRYATSRALGAAIGEACAELGGVLTTAEIGDRVREVFASSLDEQRDRYRRAVKGDSAAPTGVGDEPGLFGRQTASFSPAPGPAVAPTGPTVADSPAAARAAPEPPPEPRRSGALLTAGIAAALIAAAALAFTFGLFRGDENGRADAGARDALSASLTDAPADSPGATIPDASGPTPDSAAAGVEADAGTAHARPGRDAGVRRPPSARKKPGYFSVDSTPYATIYLDGRKLGITPLIRVRVPAGRHRVRAVTESGREQHFEIEVEPGKTTPPRQLYW